MNLTIKLRGDTEANWASTNPVLAEREVALSVDKLNFKVGNGSSAWASLGYWLRLVTDPVELQNSTGDSLKLWPTASSAMILSVSNNLADYVLGASVSGDANHRLLLRPADMFLGDGTNLDVRLYRAAADKLATPDAFNPLYVELAEITAPATPANDTLRLYAKDNGSGKTQLCVKFPGGSEIVLAIQP